MLALKWKFWLLELLEFKLNWKRWWFMPDSCVNSTFRQLSFAHNLIFWDFLNFICCLVSGLKHLLTQHCNQWNNPDVNVSHQCICVKVKISPILLHFPTMKKTQKILRKSKTFLGIKDGRFWCKQKIRWACIAEFVATYSQTGCLSVLYMAWVYDRV